MIKEGNTRIAAVLDPRTQARLDFIKDQLGIKDTIAIKLAINAYWEILQRRNYKD